MPRIKYVGADAFLNRRSTVTLYGIPFTLGKSVEVTDPYVVRKLLLQGGAFEEVNRGGRPRKDRTIEVDAQGNRVETDPEIPDEERKREGRIHPSPSTDYPDDDWEWKDGQK
jgi:hypothetical protein